MANQLRQLIETPFPLVGGFSQDLRKQISPEHLYNQYVQIPTDQKQNMALIPYPGMRPIKSLNPGIQGRKTFTYTLGSYNVMFLVISQYVYRLDNSLNPQKIGELGSNEGYVGIAGNNAYQVLFIDGTGGWVYNLQTGAFTQITDADFLTGCLSVGYLDGYFIVISPDSNQFALSEINNGLSWPVENIGELERQPGNGVAVGVVKGNVLLFGQNATETWIDTGGQLFPVARNNNALFQFGCAAVGSVAEAFDTLFWLASDNSGTGGVMMCDGGQPIKVSTKEVDDWLATYENVSDAVGDVIKINGHIFYQLSFTNANKTWLYDQTANTWSLLGDSDFDSNVELAGNRHIMQSHCYFNNAHYAVSYLDATLYQLDTFYNYYGADDDIANTIERMRITHNFKDPALRLLRISQIELYMIQGTGLGNVVTDPDDPDYDPDSNPYVEMQVSFDGGQNWTKPRRGYFGKIGKTRGSVIFYEIGIAREFTFKLTCWNAVEYVLMGGSLKYSVVGP